MNACLWFIFLCGACVYNRKRALEEKRAFSLLPSPDVNDKVSCGSGCLFDMHFKSGGGDFTTIQANLQWRFLFIIIIMVLCCGKQNSQGCQMSDKLFFFFCNDFHKT